MPTYDHCLYPEFTELLYKRLINERQSLNLYGEIGQGRSRILEDMTTILEKENIRVVNVDMKACARNFQRFLDELNDAIPLMDKDGDLAMWINGVEHSNKSTVLFLNNFDKLLGNPDIHEKFQENKFIDQINSLKNKNNIYLLCATTKSHKTQVYHIDGKIGTSPFILQEMAMPIGLSTKKIKTELNQQLNNCDDWKTCKEEDKTVYVNAINKHQQPYLLLDQIVTHIDNVGIESNNKKQQLKKWTNAFDETQQEALSKRIVKGRRNIQKEIENTGCIYPLLKGIVIFLIIALISSFVIYFFINENTTGTLVSSVVLVAAILGIISHLISIFKNTYKK